LAHQECIRKPRKRPLLVRHVSVFLGYIYNIEKSARMNLYLEKGTTMNPKTLDDLATRLAELVPDGVTNITKDIEKNMRALLQSKLSELNLVTREEFDVQQKVLANTRQQVIALEEKINELEKNLSEKSYNKK